MTSLESKAWNFIDRIGFHPLCLKDLRADGERILLTRAMVVGEIAAKLRRFAVETDGEHPEQARLLAHVGAVLEEAAELLDAVAERDNLKAIDALADLQYASATLGARLQYPVDQALEIVHRSNMSKRATPDTAGRAIKGDDYIDPKPELINALKECGL